MSLSVIIPTYFRHKDLPRLFNSLLGQIENPKEIIIVVGPGDTESINIALKWQEKLSNLIIIKGIKPSVINSLNIGLSHAHGDIIGLLDDDVWLPPNWSSIIKNMFDKDQKLGAYGGRDWLQLDDPNLSDPPLAKKVGKFAWSGKLVGNHHCGSLSSPIVVDVLKGANLSFRRSAFMLMKIDPVLEWQGAETCWEIDICQQITLAGYKIVYDNTNYVFHYISSRQEFDNRTELFALSWKKRIYNQAIVVAKFRPWYEILFFTIRSFIIGSRFTPGIIWSVLLMKNYGIKVLTLPYLYAFYTVKGLKDGITLRK